MKDALLFLVAFFVTFPLAFFGLMWIFGDGITPPIWKRSVRHISGKGRAP